MKALDLFCGLGGWSDGFASQGFDVLGVEIDPKIARLYKHDVIVADVRILNGDNFKGFDVIIGSPPCRDFSTQTQANKGYRNRKPPLPMEGLKLIRAFRNFVDSANPTFWLMENVRRMEKFWHEKPILHFYVSKRGRRSLWGNLHFPLMPDIRPQRNFEYDYVKYSYKMRSALRSKIPFSVARSIARVCRQQLEIILGGCSAAEQRTRISLSEDPGPALKGQ